MKEKKKILNEVVSGNQQWIKRIIRSGQIRFIPRMQGCLNIKLLINSKYEHLNEKETSQYIQEKVLKIQHLFVI